MKLSLSVAAVSCRTVLSCAVLSCAVLSSPAFAADYPQKPVRVIVPFAAGGPADVVARSVAQKLSERWQQPVVVDNRGGAGGNIGMTLAAQAQPDGYTLLLTTSVFMANPSLYRKTGYSISDFAPVTLTGTSATALSRHPGYTAIKSVQDLVTRSKTEAIPYASPGIGTAGHLAAELLKTITKANLQQVPYKGAGPAMTALLGAEVRVGFTAVPPVVSLSRAGRLVPLAVTSLKRLAVLPDVPAIAETYPGFQVDNMYGILAPKGTPAAVIRKVHADTVVALNDPGLRKRLEADAFEVVANTPEQFTQFIRDEFTKWAKVIKAAGARVD